MNDIIIAGMLLSCSLGGAAVMLGYIMWLASHPRKEDK